REEVLLGQAGQAVIDLVLRVADEADDLDVVAEPAQRLHLAGGVGVLGADLAGLESPPRGRSHEESGAAREELAAPHFPSRIRSQRLACSSIGRLGLAPDPSIVA